MILTPHSLPPLFNDSSMGQQLQLQNQAGGWGPSNQAASVKLEAGPSFPLLRCDGEEWGCVGSAWSCAQGQAFQECPINASSGGAGWPPSIPHPGLQGGALGLPTAQCLTEFSQPVSEG